MGCSVRLRGVGFKKWGTCASPGVTPVVKDSATRWVVGVAYAKPPSQFRESGPGLLQIGVGVGIGVGKGGQEEIWVNGAQKPPPPFLILLDYPY